MTEETLKNEKTDEEANEKKEEIDAAREEKIRKLKLERKQFRLDTVVDNLKRCDANIKLFSEKIDEQQQMKVELEITRRQLEKELLEEDPS